MSNLIFGETDVYHQMSVRKALLIQHVVGLWCTGFLGFCLVTLLLQPNLPDLIIVDEPELGLHPSALGVVASLFKRASHHAQVLISTQSSCFLDNFGLEDVIVADLQGRESRFSRPDPKALQAWLEDYSIGQVWEKNVIGGGPY